MITNEDIAESIRVRRENNESINRQRKELIKEVMINYKKECIIIIVNVNNSFRERIDIDKDHIGVVYKGQLTDPEYDSQMIDDNINKFVFLRNPSSKKKYDAHHFNQHFGNYDKDREYIALGSIYDVEQIRNRNNDDPIAVDGEPLFKINIIREHGEPVNIPGNININNFAKLYNKHNIAYACLSNGFLPLNNQLGNGFNECKCL
jgi:hypothetical protein